MKGLGKSVFFDPERANFLQQIAIFLEFGGMLFIVIEIYFKKLADSIENYFDKKSEINLRKISRLHGTIYQKLDKIYDKLVYIADISRDYISNRRNWGDIIIVLILIFLLHFVGFALQVGHYLLAITAAPFLILLYLVSFSTLAFYIFYTGFVLILVIPIVPVALSLQFMDWIAQGKAFGGLGLMLAVSGLLLEIYQVVELCLNDGCYGYPPFR